MGVMFWAARHNTWLLIKLTPKGAVFSFFYGCDSHLKSHCQLMGEWVARHIPKPGVQAGSG